jgi:hypothetical protein
VTPRAVVHIGLPKAGSTAFQLSLLRHRDLLIAQGVRPLIYEGRPDQQAPATRSLDLAALVVRPELDAWFRLAVPETHLAAFQRRGRASVRAQVSSAEPVIVASMEDLCLIRTGDEVQRLLELMEPRTLHVVLALRHGPSYRRSLIGQLAKSRLPTWSAEPDSCLNVAPQSWLFDQDALLNLLETELGAQAVTVVDYDQSVRLENSVVPALWRACGLPTAIRLADDWVNVSSSMTHTGVIDLETIDDPDALRAVARRQQAELDAAYRSRSWRWTASLRAAGTLIRRAFRPRTGGEGNSPRGAGPPDPHPGPASRRRRRSP